MTIAASSLPLNPRGNGIQSQEKVNFIILKKNIAFENEPENKTPQSFWLFNNSKVKLEDPGNPGMLSGLILLSKLSISWKLFSSQL